MEDYNQNPFQIFAKLLDGKTATLRFTAQHAYGHAIKQRIFEITKIPTQSQRLTCCGNLLTDDTILSTPESTICLSLRLRGGKGGFGSLLRGAATKAGQKKTNNFDACRDMSGRRLRHVNAEKRLEEWKVEEEERRLEKIAEDFIKKKAKKGKKGVGDGAAEKYVEKYREESAKCAAKVEEAVREACGSGKRNGKSPIEGVETKKLKIWMGKRKLGEIDCEEMDDDSSDDDNDHDEENEKSVVLNNGNHSDTNRKAEGGSDSVPGGKQGGGCSTVALCKNGSEEEKEDAVGQSLDSSPCGEIVPHEEVVVIEPEIHEEMLARSAIVTFLEAAEVSGIEALKTEKQEIVGPDSQSLHVSSSGNGEVTESRPVLGETSTICDSKADFHEETAVANGNTADLEKTLNFDEFNLAEELEVLGMERLKTELQNRGLKCGGTLHERAARLFVLKSTPLEKLPKKLFAKK